jgi:hypothetical protein
MRLNGEWSLLAGNRVYELSYLFENCNKLLKCLNFRLHNKFTGHFIIMTNPFWSPVTGLCYHNAVFRMNVKNQRLRTCGILISENYIILTSKNLPGETDKYVAWGETVKSQSTVIPASPANG